MRGGRQIDSNRQGLGLGPVGAKTMNRRVLLITALVIIGATVALYARTWHFGFVGWDDTRYVVDSPLVTQPGGLWRIWASGEAEQYYPLTFTSFWFEYRLWGGQAGGYHVVNLAIHVVNVLLVIALTRFLKQSPWVTWVVAAFFAIHPVQVQTVAWIAQRKNVLSTLFVLLALLAWGRFRSASQPVALNSQPTEGTGRHSRAWYAISLVCFMSALLCKSAVLTLPLVLAALDRLAWNIPWRRIFVSLAPMLIPIVGSAAATLAFEKEFVGWSPEPWSRPLIAAAALWFYVAQVALPVTLVPLHARWDVSAEALAWWVPLLGLFIASGVLWRFKRRLPIGVQFGLIFFVAFLLPVLGLISYGNLALSLVSDHYLYLPLIGGLLALGNFLEGILRHNPRVRVAGHVVLGLLMVAAWIASWQYLPTFRDSLAMWSYTLSRNPQCPAAHAGLGRYFEDQRSFQESLDHYRRASEIAPSVENGLDVARVLRRMNDWDQAEAILTEVKSRFPSAVEPMLDLARMARQQRRFDVAEARFREAAVLQPNAAIEIEWGAMYLGLARRDMAEARFRAAMVADPREARAYLGLATSLRGQSRAAEAVGVLRAGLQSVPGDLRLLNMLARILATSPEDGVRDGAEAVRLAEQASRNSKQQDYEVLDTLSAAYAEAGRWDEALATLELAASRAEAAGDPAFASALQHRKVLFRNGQPWREEVITTHRRLQGE